MAVICLFILIVVLGAAPGVLGDEIRCFWHMFTILQILRRARPTDIPRLRWEILQHHLLYIVLFPLCVKHNLHYLFHVPRCWYIWECLLSCYGADADNRDVSRIFRLAMRDPSSAATYHAVHQLFEAVCTETTYEEAFLMPTVTPCSEEFTVGGQKRCTATATSRSMQATCGIIREHDCMIWKDGGTRQCGKALFFAQIQRPTPHALRVEVVCIARRFDKSADGWYHDQGTNVCVGVAAIEFTVAFAQDGRRIMPLVPDL
mgnify:CR=1 FL=1